jgi:hypothetical protein
MHRRFWDRTMVISFSVGAAGILTCVAILVDSLFPTGSVLAALASMAALGVAVLVVVAGYVWVCDKCQDYFSERLGRLFGKRSGEPRDEGNAKEPLAPKDAGRQRKVPPASQPDGNRGRQVEARYGILRWSPLSPQWPGTAQWRGQ